jgi:hypothetical protein
MGIEDNRKVHYQFLFIYCALMYDCLNMHLDLIFVYHSVNNIFLYLCFSYPWNFYL